MNKIPPRRAVVKDETIPTVVRWRPALDGVFDRKLEAYVPGLGWRTLLETELREVESLGPVWMNPSAHSLKRLGVPRG